MSTLTQQLVSLTRDDLIFSRKDLDKVQETLQDSFLLPREKKLGLIDYFIKVLENPYWTLDPVALNYFKQRLFPRPVRQLAQKIEERQKMAGEISDHLWDKMIDDDQISQEDLADFKKANAGAPSAMLGAGVALCFYKLFYSPDVYQLEDAVLATIIGDYGNFVSSEFLALFQSGTPPPSEKPDALLKEYFGDGALQAAQDLNGNGEMNDFDYWVALLHSAQASKTIPFKTIQHRVLPTLRDLGQEGKEGYQTARALFDCWANELSLAVVNSTIQLATVKNELPPQEAANHVALGFTPNNDFVFFNIVLTPKDQPNNSTPSDSTIILRAGAQDTKAGTPIVFNWPQAADQASYTLEIYALEQQRNKYTLYTYQQEDFKVSRSVMITRVQINLQDEKLVIDHNLVAPPSFNVTYCGEFSTPLPNGERFCPVLLAGSPIIFAANAAGVTHEPGRATIPFPLGVTKDNLKEVMVTAPDPYNRGMGYQTCIPVSVIPIEYDPVLFKLSSAEPTSDNEAKKLDGAVKTILEKLRGYPQGSQGKEWKVYVVGATDKTGELDFNQTLSEARAKFVADILAKSLGQRTDKNAGLPLVVVHHTGVGEAMAGEAEVDPTKRQVQIYLGVDPPQLELELEKQIAWQVISADSGIAGPVALSERPALITLEPVRAVIQERVIERVVPGEVQVQVVQTIVEIDKIIEVPPPPRESTWLPWRFAAGAIGNIGQLTLYPYNERLLQGGGNVYGSLSREVVRAREGENSGPLFGGSFFVNPFGVIFFGDDQTKGHVSQFSFGLTEELWGHGSTDGKHGFALGALEEVTFPYEVGGTAVIGTKDYEVNLQEAAPTIDLGGHLYVKEDSWAGRVGIKGDIGGLLKGEYVTDPTVESALPYDGINVYLMVDKKL